MNRKTLCALLTVLFCVAGIICFQALAASNSYGSAQRNQVVTGTMVGVGGRYGGRTRPFRMVINRYTSPGDVERINAAMQSGGQDELLRVLSGLDAGQISIGNGVGVTANAIIAVPQGDRTKIIVLYRRNINFFELRYGTRSEDYKFGYAEMYLRPNGTGEGTLIPAARVRLRDGNNWEVEDFGEFPARLMGLRITGSVAR